MSTAIETNASEKEPVGTPHSATFISASRHLPKSAVSEATGLIGVVSLFCATMGAAYFEVSLLQSIMMLLGLPAATMVASTILLDKAHMRASTGLDYGLARQRSEVMEITVTKTIGLGATFLVIALAYQLIPTYEASKYELTRALSLVVFPLLWILSPIYIAFTTRHMVDPRDELWHFGKLVTLNYSAVDRQKVKDHCRAWLVKGFFLAFMISILPTNIHSMINADLSNFFSKPLPTVFFLIQLTFFVDVCIGTIGYLCTFKALDSHIRTANPYLSSWVAALICYPPFILITSGGPLDYKSGTLDWTYWFEGMPLLLTLWGAAIVVLAVTYAWATVAFGIRFSNLTHRGIITTGPFRYAKHPAYLSKNVMWWLMSVPFLSNLGTAAAFQSCILLIGVNAVYYARAKTEEKHLMTDVDYREYSEWIKANGLFARVLSGRRKPHTR